MAEVGIKVTEIPEKQSYKLTLTLPAAEYERLTARADKEGRLPQQLLREAIHWFVQVKGDLDDGWHLEEVHWEERGGEPLRRLLLIP